MEERPTLSIGPVAVLWASVHSLSGFCLAVPKELAVPGGYRGHFRLPSRDEKLCCREQEVFYFFWDASQLSFAVSDHGRDRVQVVHHGNIPIVERVMEETGIRDPLVVRCRWVLPL